jgi:hypothetical protein
VSESTGAVPAEVPTALHWRLPPYQTALLILVVCACAALNIYFDPSSTVAAATIVLGLVCLVLAAAGLRMFLYVDEEGAAVRHLGRASWLPWSEVERVEIASGVRGADTIRFVRHGGSYVDVPPSLLQPARPMSKPRALGRLKGILGEIQARKSL